MAKELSLFRGRCPTLERRRLWSATQNGNGERGISNTEDVAEGGQKKTACRAAKTTLSFLRKEKLYGARYWFRTSDPRRVKAMLYH